MNSDRIVKAVLLSFLLIIPIVFAFFWEIELSPSAPIDSGKFGTFGDFIGGVLGSFWALCGVGLFYVALKEQRTDFKTNTKALEAQLNALALQTKEFEAQRVELELTREIFIEQAETLRQQRLETTYFSLLDLYNKMIADLNTTVEACGYFKSLKSDLFAAIFKVETPVENHAQAIEIYLGVFYNAKDELAQYFRLVYRIIKFIDDSNIREEEKFRYIKILRSQLSECEMVALYYNSLTDYGKKSYKLILKYNLLKHLTCSSKVEFSKYKDLSQNTGLGANLHRFNAWFTSITEDFLVKFEISEKQDEFSEYVVSYNIPLVDDVIIGLRAEYSDQLYITLSKSDNSEILQLFDMDIDTFSQYFKELLYDSFFFSRYINFDESLDYVNESVDENTLTFEIKGNRKLELTMDME